MFRSGQIIFLKQEWLFYINYNTSKLFINNLLYSFTSSLNTFNTVLLRCIMLVCEFTISYFDFILCTFYMDMYEHRLWMKLWEELHWQGHTLNWGKRPIFYIIQRYAENMGFALLEICTYVQFVVLQDKQLNIRTNNFKCKGVAMSSQNKF